jgi:hypothetical protein
MLAYGCKRDNVEDTLLHWACSSAIISSSIVGALLLAKADATVY